jgi:hypothetical protein
MPTKIALIATLPPIRPHKGLPDYVIGFPSTQRPRGSLFRLVTHDPIELARTDVWLTFLRLTNTLILKK